MAVYRIKKEADQEKQIFTGEEYWQISPLEEDLPYLDMKEIAELNLLAEDMPIPKAKMGFWGQAIMSIVFLLITFALLIGMSGIYFRQPLPDLGFLSQSSQLQEDPLLQKAAQSVVRVEMAQSHGSGFNIAADGLIITNHHVLEGVGNINIRFADGSLFTDCPWQAVEGFDLAVIDIKGHDLPFLPMAELFPKVDDPIFFIGNPLDFNFVFS
ncbi:MAG: trypsin-like peptidase domain-containing protein, partial [Clostridiales bacterium]